MGRKGSGSEEGQDGKILPGGNRPFSVRGIGGSQEKGGQRETFGGQREVKIFYSEQQGSWRIFGACGGRQGVRAFWRES